MSIKKIDIEKLAQLAKLRLTEPEKEKFATQLTQIIAYIDKLNMLNTEHVDATHHVFELTNVFRDDTVKKGLSQQEALQNAPAQKMGFLSVPKVIPNES